jgi:hypothetical protein
MKHTAFMENCQFRRIRRRALTFERFFVYFPVKYIHNNFNVFNDFRAFTIANAPVSGNDSRMNPDPTKKISTNWFLYIGHCYQVCL